jgi:hypothetical protein
MMASAAKGGAGGRHRFLDGVEHRQAEMGAPALAGRDAADDVGAVIQHLLGVEGALVAGDALDDDRGGLVDEDAHGAVSPQCFV